MPVNQRVFDRIIERKNRDEHKKSFFPDWRKEALFVWGGFQSAGKRAALKAENLVDAEWQEWHSG